VLFQKFNPPVIFAPLPSLKGFASGGWFDFSRLIKLAIKRNADAAINLNSTIQLETDLPPFALPDSPNTPCPPSRFDPSTTSIEFLRRSARSDQTTKRQVEYPKKVLFPIANEWVDLEFEKDLSTGPVLVQVLTEAGNKIIDETVSDFRTIFKWIGLESQTIVHASVFVMDLLFKPNFGQWLPNGDIGIGAKDWHFGVVDYRQREGWFVRDMDRKLHSFFSSFRGTVTDLRSFVTATRRALPSRTILLDKLNESKKSIAAYKKMFASIGDVEERRSIPVALTDEELEIAQFERNVQDRNYRVRRAEYDRRRIAGEDVGKFVHDPRRRRLRRFHDPTIKIFTFTPRFLLDDKDDFSFSPPRRPNLKPPSDHPVKIWDQKVPHLYIRGVPQGYDELSKPARALSSAYEFFEELNIPDTPTRPAIMADDSGEVIAEMRGFLKLTEEKTGSVVHAWKQQRYATEQSENARTMTEVSKWNPNRRLEIAMNG